MRRALLAILVIACGGCSRDRSPPSPPPAAPSMAAAPPAAAPPTGASVIEKIGVRFVRVPPTGGIDFVATNAVPCSQGEHEAVRCPRATPLAGPAMNDAQRFAAHEVSLLDGVTAHRLCAMRFGGRLPTPSERAGMRDLRGLASLLVVQSSDASRRFRFLELPEWVEEGDCGNPSAPAAACAITTFPRASAADALLWDQVLSCDATRVTDAGAAAVTELGQACPSASTLTAGATTLPCVLKMPAPPGAVAELYTLACQPPEPGRAHPDPPAVAPAAFRCMVPASALGVK